MKKIFKYLFIAAASMSVMSCDSLFDNIEGDLTKMTAEDMLSTETGIRSILANIYSGLPGFSISTSDQNTMFAASSRSKQSYGVSGVTGFWDYGKMRTINKFIESLNDAAKKGIITERIRDQYIGEATFIRAYEYFCSVRVYGGIPFVFEVLDSKYDGKENAGLYIPRSTEKESYDTVLAELDKAIELLPESQGTYALRANKYTALAYKARVALWAASESKYWENAAINKSYNAYQKGLTKMEATDANDYYKQAIEAAAKVIASGKYALVNANPASPEAAKQTLVDLFQSYNTTEGIFGRSYNDGDSSTSTGIEQEKQGGWFKTGAYLSGSYSVTLNMVDMFDNYTADYSRADGRIQTLADHMDLETEYISGLEDVKSNSVFANHKHYASPSAPFVNKDARFQAWVSYPGSTFRGKTMNIQGGLINQDGSVSIYPTNNNPVVGKDGNNYYPFGAISSETWCFEGLNVNINEGNRNEYGFWIAKFLDPDKENYMNSSPWYDMRYSEVLLTYAEAVAESGLGDATLAAKCLNDVRHRAGFKDNIALSVDNVLHEWAVEFAFENQWSKVLYRRRAFYNDKTGGNNLEGHIGQKLALVPIVDLTKDTPDYIFARAITYFNDPKRNTATIGVTPESYYSQVPNYANNGIEKNNE